MQIFQVFRAWSNWLKRLSTKVAMTAWLALWRQSKNCLKAKKSQTEKMRIIKDVLDVVVLCHQKGRTSSVKTLKRPKLKTKRAWKPQWCPRSATTNRSCKRKCSRTRKSTLPESSRKLKNRVLLINRKISDKNRSKIKHQANLYHLLRSRHMPNLSLAPSRQPQNGSQMTMVLR